MTPRPLQWLDLRVVFSRSPFTGRPKDQCPVWKNRSGDTRIYVCLDGCSFVNKTFWIKGPEKESELTPTQQAMILLEMTRMLAKKVKAIRHYLKIT